MVSDKVTSRCQIKSTTLLTLSDTTMPQKSCPNCGAEVPPKAKACPECGADEETGWSETAYASGLGIPDEEEKFDYDNFVKEEFGARQTKPHGISWFWWFVALLLVALMVFLFVR